ncbi:hypothetical protein ACFX2C_028454 [Malus domestica]
MYGLMFTVSTDFKKFEGHVPGHFSMIKQGICSRGLHEDSGKFKFTLSARTGEEEADDPSSVGHVVKDARFFMCSIPTRNFLILAGRQTKWLID